MEEGKGVLREYRHSRDVWMYKARCSMNFRVISRTGLYFIGDPITNHVRWMVYLYTREKARARVGARWRERENGGIRERRKKI